MHVSWSGAQASRGGHLISVCVHVTASFAALFFLGTGSWVLH